MPRGEFTLQKKLLRWLLIPLSLLLVIDGVASYVVATRLSNVVYDRDLTEVAHELLLHLEDRGDGIRLDLSRAALRTLLLDQYDKVYFRIGDGNGVLVAGDMDIPPPAGGRVASGSPAFYDNVLSGEKIRVVRLHDQLPGTGPGQSVVIQVAETLNKRNTLAVEILGSIVLPQLLLIVIAGMLVWIGVAQGLSPLKRLQQAIAARSHLDLTPVARDDVPGEVKPLMHAIDDLMVRLSEVLEFQNRFIADAAHQLRTPVAGLKAHIEVALRESDPAQIKHTLAHLYTSVERLSRLVSQLLSLARNEPSTIKSVNLDPLDLNKLAFETTMEWVPEAYKKDIDLGFEGVNDVLMIRGDPVRLRELINNLLDNAIRYSRNGGRVTVRVSPRPRPCLSVSDDGPSIPVDQRQRVFERFHRLLGTHSDGTGLGLAIVQEIAAIHGAEIVLADDVDGIGNTFTVLFSKS